MYIYIDPRPNISRMLTNIKNVKKLSIGALWRQG